jgi:hypothetical protein
MGYIGFTLLIERGLKHFDEDATCDPVRVRVSLLAPKLRSPFPHAFWPWCDSLFHQFRLTSRTYDDSLSFILSKLLLTHDSIETYYYSGRFL